MRKQSAQRRQKVFSNNSASKQNPDTRAGNGIMFFQARILHELKVGLIPIDRKRKFHMMHIYAGRLV